MAPTGAVVAFPSSNSAGIVSKTLLLTTLHLPYSDPGTSRPLPLAIQSVAPVWYGGWLERHWTPLQRARPTPAGMLIGCAVHDTMLGGGTATE
jgi:hypothetical protein